ncbi:putative nucleic acid-binding protein [Helianthus annuus]|nr:putative nucleic acid-binding protein [Helianthus annuus]KAJ0567589.1 putative nucleic acid-binding protein [Helianthus annuus]KAJ0916044.1 putative nucleic acid-binding protein [Helianthus annuus]
MEPEKLPTTTICTVVSIDHTDLHYTNCSLCERTLPDSLTRCNHCPGSGSTSKRIFRVLMSVATQRVRGGPVDRAARVLFGCSAHDFFSFTNTHPFSGPVVIFNY